MLTEKPLAQERELKMQRQRLSKSTKIHRKLKSPDWWTDSPRRHFRRSWLLSETVWVILQVWTMGRMGKMRMVKKPGRASWAQMTNPAGWWAQSPKLWRSAWRGFGRSWWSLTKCDNWDRRTQPTMALSEIQCMAHQNWGFWQSFNHKWMMIHRLLHEQHLESWWRVMTMSSEYCKFRKGLLNQGVVISGCVQGSRSGRGLDLVLRPRRGTSHHAFRLRSLLNLYNFTPAYCLPS